MIECIRQSGCPHSFWYNKTLVLRFLLLLFDTTSRSRTLQADYLRYKDDSVLWAVSLNQPWLTAVMGLSPPPGSPAAAPIAMSVAVQKYHCRLFRSWRGNLPQIALWTDIFRSTSLMLSCLRIVIYPQMVLACPPKPLSLHRAEQLTYLSCWI